MEIILAIGENMSNVLAFDACSSVSCVIFSDERMLCDFTLDVKSTHSQNLGC